MWHEAAGSSAGAQISDQFDAGIIPSHGHCVKRAMLCSLSIQCTDGRNTSTPETNTGLLDCMQLKTAASCMTDVRLRKKLEPLNRMDRARETEYITNVGQLKHNILRYAVAPVTHFTAQTTEPSVAHVPLHNACMRIRESWEAATGAAASPQLLRDQAWTQACLPSEGYGGFNLMPATCLLDVHGNPFSHNYTATFLACWPQLRVLLPDLHGVDPTAADAPRFAKEAVAGYVELRRRREVSAAIHSRVDKHFTQRGGNYGLKRNEKTQKKSLNLH